jgi:hypothetical protein
MRMTVTAAQRKKGKQSILPSFMEIVCRSCGLARMSIAFQLAPSGRLRPEAD